ncbi:MAG: EamA family transporter [Fimbriimonas sp.]|nr:EamA family transporter [Fimbriimonas sp.]
MLAKKGVENVPSNLAVAVRVAVVLVFAVVIAMATKQTKIGTITTRGWMFLTASGIATGASWLCYFRAIQLGPVSRVAPIDKLSFVIAVVIGILVLGERPSWNIIGGAALICCGVLVTLR